MKLTPTEKTVIKEILDVEPQSLTGAAVSTTEVVSRFPEKKRASVKKALLSLAHKGMIFLQHHSFNAAIPAKEKALMPNETNTRGEQTYYVGLGFWEPENLPRSIFRELYKENPMRRKRKSRNGLLSTAKGAIKKTVKVGTAAIKGAMKSARSAAKNPSLTDQEVIVLRAMFRVEPRARSGAMVSIWKLLENSGLAMPKHRIKKILLGLASKGVVALHEHDLPSSMSREQRKNNIVIEGTAFDKKRGQTLIYYNGVSIRDGVVLPPEVRNPQIRQIVRDYIRVGLNQSQALKQMRSAGFRPAQIAEAKRIFTKEKGDVRALASGRRNPRGGAISEADIARLPEKAQRQIREQLGKIEVAETKASTPKQRQVVERRRRSLLSRIGTRLRLIGQTKKFKVQARNLNKAPLKTVKIRARHEADALAKARARLGSGYDNFRVRNRSRRKAGNPSLTFTITAKAKGKKPAPKRNGVVSKLRKLREDFTGQPRRSTKTLFAPNGTPSRLAKLGKLISIKTATKTIKASTRNPHTEVWLCADHKGRLHLCSPMSRLIDGPARSFGEVMEIEYQTAKPHLGHRRLTDFYHELGEEGGRRPTLHADGAGGLRFKGGDYFITPEGLRD